MYDGRALKYTLTALLVLIVATGAFAEDVGAPVQPTATPEALVLIALDSNPNVVATKAQFEAAVHQIRQAYVPRDPIVSVQDAQSVFGLDDPKSQAVSITQAFQFPGKAWLQGDQAHHNAEIYRLKYLAAVRDTRAEVLTLYYQTLLDTNLAKAAETNSIGRWRIMDATRVAFAAGKVTRSDFLSAQFDLAQATEAVESSRVAEANDESALNQILGRDPRAPLPLSQDMDLQPLSQPLDKILEIAMASRQEILAAALSENNADDAVKLARMEWLPDFSVSYTRTRYPQMGPGAITPSNNGASIGISVPIFGWWKQKEDIESAKDSLAASIANQSSVDLQTATAVTQLYRTTQNALKKAQLNRDYLTPLAEEDFTEGLAKYEGRKIDFSTLAGILQRIYSAQVGYLNAANQFLSGKIALQQMMGGDSSL